MVSPFGIPRSFTATSARLSDKLSLLKSTTTPRDRKSTRLNSSHANISYAVFCLKKKTTHCHPPPPFPRMLLVSLSLSIPFTCLSHLFVRLSSPLSTLSDSHLPFTAFPCPPSSSR